MYWKHLVVSVLIILVTQSATSVDISDVADIIEIARDVIKNVYKAWDVIENQIRPDDNLQLPFVRKREEKVLKLITEVSRKLAAITSAEQRSHEVLAAVLKQLPKQLRLELRLNDLADMTTRIQVSHEQMMTYVNHTDTIERVTLEDYASWIVSHDTSGVRALLERIHAMVAPAGAGILDRGILSILRENMEEANSELCNLNQSPHQLLYNLYNSIALTELKGYAMTQFSYMLLKLYDKGNFTQEAELMSNRYKERAEQTIGAVKRAMEGASRQLWNCDPKHYEEGKNYEQLTELLQGYIENEVDMNDAGTCRENCAAYTYTHSYGCFKDLYCSRQRRCNGKIINCRFVDSDMWICPGNDNSHRRYEYIEYENSRTLGRKLNCAKGVTKVDSWWRWLFWHCSYCLCLCDEQSSTSDRFFNLRNVFANHTANKVVTGLRFVKVNRVIHLQIQQGELLPRGNIAQNTLQWVPVDDYKITDRNVYNGQDYHTMTWNERAIDLDDLVVPAGHILTGVRFRRVGSHLNFEVQSCPFNFTTGKLDDPKQLFVWTSNDNTDANMETPRKKLMLQSPDIPTRSPLPSAPDSQSDQFMHFTHTDIDKDAAQTTVPFLDSQPVVSQIAVPLSGAGIYHKGQLGFGGFLAPKIITYDFGAHLKPAFPQEDIVN